MSHCYAVIERDLTVSNLQSCDLSAQTVAQLFETKIADERHLRNSVKNRKEKIGMNWCYGNFAHKYLLPKFDTLSCSDNRRSRGKLFSAISENKKGALISSSLIRPVIPARNIANVLDIKQLRYVT